VISSAVSLSSSISSTFVISRVPAAAKIVAELEVAAPAKPRLLETIAMSTPSNCHGFLQKEPDGVVRHLRTA
jgi:hypothetical protein